MKNKLKNIDMKSIIYLLTILILFNKTYSQSSEKCSVDLKLLNAEGKKTRDRDFQEVEYSIINENIPDYGKSKEITVKWAHYERDASDEEKKIYKKYLKKDISSLLCLLNDTTFIKTNKVFKIREQSLGYNEWFIVYYGGFDTLNNQQKELFEKEELMYRSSTSSFFKCLGQSFSVENKTIYLQIGLCPFFHKGSSDVSLKYYLETQNYYMTNNLTYDFQPTFKNSKGALFKILMFDAECKNIARHNLENIVIRKKYYLEINKLLKKINTSNVLVKEKSKKELTKLNSTDTVTYDFLNLKLNISGEHNMTFDLNNTFNNAIIFDETCLSYAKNEFKNKKLPIDAKNDAQLKAKLLEALNKSAAWHGYEIYNVIFTEESDWQLIKSNPYSAFVDYRFIVTNAYVKNKKTGVCYLVKNLSFNQKNEPLKGFIHEILIDGFPQEEIEEDFEIYPCMLK